jgi:hypothetical protein
MIYDILHKLNSTTKRNEKIQILSDNKDNELLKTIFFYALNPYYSYNIKKIPKYLPSSEKFSLTDFIFFLDRLRNREVTGNAAIDELTFYLSNMNINDSSIAVNILSKDLRCGTSTATVNAVWDNLIPTYPCLLAEPYSKKLVDKHITFPAISQLKSDGVRVNIFVSNTGVVLKSRSGRDIDVLGMFDHLVDYIENNQSIVLDGELLVTDKDNNILPRKIGNGIINKAIKGTIKESEAKNIVASIWDIIPQHSFFSGTHPVPYIHRFDEVSKFIERNPPKLYLIPTVVVDSIEEAQEHFSSMLSNGEEGTMLKDINHIWEDKRSNKILKMKSELECEMQVTDWVQGTGKYEGLLGNIVCRDKSGKVIVSVGSGFSDNQRTTIKPDDIVGQIVTIRYNEIIKSADKETMSLFLPRFVDLRLDKDEPDDLSTNADK